MNRFSLPSIALSVLLVAVFSWSADRVVGANQTLDLDPAAHAAGAGGALLAMPGTALEAGQNPVGMLDLPDHAAGVSHTRQFEDTQLDGFALVYALDSLTRAGLVFTRFSAEDIPYIPEGEPLPADNEWKTFSIADYALSLLAARSFRWHLDAALGMHFLYRELDQTGFGFRGDAALRWRPTPYWFFAGKLDGWTSSAARWESGQVEYSSPEVRLATGVHIPVKYLYGTLHCGYQSAGMLHHGNRWMSVSNSILGDTTAQSGASASAGGDRMWESPLQWFRDGSLGAELAWDWGGSVRGGWQSLREWDSWTMGAGVRFHGWVGVDYSFQRHPVLSSIHRVSLEIRPWWKSTSHGKAALVPTEESSLIPVQAVEVEEESVQQEEILEDIPQESDGKSWEE